MLGTDEQVRLLEQGDLKVLGLLPRASNYTFLARVTDRDEQTLAVYKPRAGEAPLWDFDDGSLCRREVAAYLVADALGWPSVPPTILRDGPDGVGMVQLFVEFDPQQHFFTMQQERPDDFRRVALFDALANNADRKAGHCLLSTSGELFCIDHGVCFHAEPKLRTVIWDFAGEPIRDDLVKDLEALAQKLRSEPLRDRLATLLAEDELTAMERRVARLIASGRFPEPGPGRPYPWPPV